MKRIVALILCLSLVLLFSGCEVLKNQTSVVDVAMVEGEFSQSIYDEIFSQTENVSYVTYNSITDAVIAVENGKAKYTVFNDFQLNDFMVAQREVSLKEKSSYFIDYCAYFNSSNTQLQAMFNKAIFDLQKNGSLENIKEFYIKNRYYETEENNENGSLVMLCYPYFDNRIFLDDADNIQGVDLEIAKAICSYLGYGLEIKTADFDELFIMLDNGEGDFIISASQLNAERSRHYLSSQPYYTENFYVVESG